jgi:hypothetical protein
MATVRMTQETLNSEYRVSPHEFQKIRVQQMLEKGWNVSKVVTYNNLALVFVHTPGAVAVVYRNGLLVRNKAGKKISASWADAAKYASATVPTPGLVIA